MADVFAARSLLREGRAFLGRFKAQFHKPLSRTLLLEAQGGKCYICRHDMLSRKRAPASGEQDTLDHVWPLALYGPNYPGNFAMAHQRCNGEKASRLPTLSEMEALLEINRKLGWPTPECIRVHLDTHARDKQEGT